VRPEFPSTCNEARTSSSSRSGNRRNDVVAPRTLRSKTGSVAVEESVRHQCSLAPASGSQGSGRHEAIRCYFGAESSLAGSGAKARRLTACASPPGCQ
jgi:hypothetical protein